MMVLLLMMMIILKHFGENWTHVALVNQQTVMLVDMTMMVTCDLCCKPGNPWPFQQIVMMMDMIMMMLLMMMMILKHLGVN